MNESDGREATADEAMGMAWWNSLSEESRMKWARKAGTGVVADAWAAFKTDSDARTKVDGCDAMFPPAALPTGLGRIPVDLQSKS